MDFMADRLDDGRRIRILTVEDVFTRECLAVEVDTSLVSARVVAVLGRLVQARGAPAVISVDNGSEFYSRTTDSWAYRQGVRMASRHAARCKALHLSHPPRASQVNDRRVSDDRGRHRR